MAHCAFPPSITHFALFLLNVFQRGSLCFSSVYLKLRPVLSSVCLTLSTVLLSIYLTLCTVSHLSVSRCELCCRLSILRYAVICLSRGALCFSSVYLLVTCAVICLSHAVHCDDICLSYIVHCAIMCYFYIVHCAVICLSHAVHCAQVAYCACHLLLHDVMDLFSLYCVYCNMIVIIVSIFDVY
jgi:hypothetical protein